MLELKKKIKECFEECNKWWLLLTNNNKYNVRRNYFRVVAKNKYIYYLSKFILEIGFVTLAIYSFIINKLYLYVITIICMFLYLGLYEGRRIGDFKDVKKIYIDRDSKKKK